MLESVRRPPDASLDHQQTTVPKEVCDALDIGPGDKLTWEVHGGRVAVTTERPAFCDGSAP